MTGFEELGDRSFSFYPAIVGFEHNEWRMVQGTWSEVLVTNCGTNQEIWIPRGYVGEVSSTDDPVMIVGLTRELEFKGGMLIPYQPRLIRMPSGSPTSISSANEPTPPKAFRLDPSDKRIFRLVGIAVACFVAIYVIALGAFRIGDIRQLASRFSTADQDYQVLTARDDRFAIVQKLGEPKYDRARDRGGIQFEAMSYTDRRYTVILMGDQLGNVKYIGTLDDGWKPIHWASIRSGGSYEALLRTLDRF
jgi:hypothetical protein